MAGFDATRWSPGVPMAALTVLLLTGGAGCLVEEHCYSAADCPGGICQAGRCLTPDIWSPPDGRPPIACPADMVNVDNRFCMDRYEASRPDATATGEGSDSSRATSRKGVMPWFSYSLTLGTARAACKAAGKRLCRLQEWIFGCQGPEKLVYGYGNTYDPVRCNGIDTYCYCNAGACAGKSPCPFALCYHQCGADFKPMPTGAFARCESPFGAFDINGNVWELADTSDGALHFRGGAYNCSDSRALHRCDHDGTWGPSAQGFRCCSDGASGAVDLGAREGSAGDLQPRPDRGAADAPRSDAPPAG